MNAKTLREVTEILARDPSDCGERCEGVVVRLADGFSDEDFSRSVAKWVRADHVQTDDHWKHRTVVRNHLAKDQA